MGALVNPVVDPISHQPESKYTPVGIKTYQAAWHGFILSRHPLDFNHPEYLVKVKGNQFYRYELAGEIVPESWEEWSKNILCSASNEAPQWQEYADPAQNKYRAARILDNQLLLFSSF
ncbi:hypothetical protein BMR04_07325 [Methylococcaceae bacterium HT3]|nr:hypothetical protein BMR04_07325 [Methylococcaceae bacterium HT3]